MHADNPIIHIGTWELDPATGRLRDSDHLVELEPKTAEVLLLLAARRGQVVSREEILDQVWPDTSVSLGALARCISKLRKALGDDAQAPRFIETLPKRGYRLMDECPAPPASPSPASPAPEPSVPDVRPTPPQSDTPNQTPTKEAQEPRTNNITMLSAAVGVLGLLFTVGFVWWRQTPAPAVTDPMLQRAEDFYYQYTRGDNESAMTLYQRILAENPNSAPATLGLANTLVQTVLRWPETLGAAPAAEPNLANALAEQRVDTPQAQLMLQRAEALAQRAVRLDADNPKAHRTLGLVQATLRRFDDAHQSYQRALTLDPTAWGTLINQSDLYSIQNQPKPALAALEKAYAAMTENYDREPVHIRPWYPEIGRLIGNKHAAAGRLEDAEIWYRRVLEHSPYHVTTTIDLAKLLHAAGDRQKAAELCRSLTTRVGPLAECSALTQP